MTDSDTLFYDAWVADLIQKITTQMERFPESRLFALIDCAQIEAAAKDVFKWKTDFSRPLFGDSKEASLENISPWLLQSPIGFDQAKFLKKCISLQGDTHAVTWIMSPLPAKTLFERLCLRMDATLPGNMEMLLRYFDTYRLPDLHQVLHEEQRKTFFSCADAWIYLDRQGEIAVINSVFSEFDEQTKLVFDETQEQAILDAAFPDELLRILQKDQPDLIEIIPPQERYDRVKTLIAQAHAHGIDGSKDLLYFCILGLSEGNDFDASPAWSGVFNRMKADHLSFADAALAQAE